MEENTCLTQTTMDERREREITRVRRKPFFLYSRKAKQEKFMLSIIRANVKEIANYCLTSVNGVQKNRMSCVLLCENRRASGYIKANEHAKKILQVKMEQANAVYLFGSVEQAQYINHTLTASAWPIVRCVVSATHYLYLFNFYVHYSTIYGQFMGFQWQKRSTIFCWQYYLLIDVCFFPSFAKKKYQLL